MGEHDNPREKVTRIWTRGHLRTGDSETIQLIDCGIRDNNGHRLWRAVRFLQGHDPEDTPPANESLTLAAIGRWTGNAFISYEVRRPTGRPPREYTPVRVSAA